MEVAEGEVPEETGGPFPADGSNGVNVLAESGIVRSDITGSFGSASGVVKGVPMTMALTLLNMNDGDVKPYEARPSMCGTATPRGGTRCTTREPSTRTGSEACRWPTHRARSSSSRSSQARTPDGGHTSTSRSTRRRRPPSAPATSCGPHRSRCRRTPPATVYARSDYPGSSDNLSKTSLKSDMVFSDGYSLQMAKVTGSVDDGMTINLSIAV